MKFGSISGSRDTLSWECLRGIYFMMVGVTYYYWIYSSSNTYVSNVGIKVLHMIYMCVTLYR